MLHLFPHKLKILYLMSSSYVMYISILSLILHLVLDLCQAIINQSFI
uniref:Uncharacterized protein n=1 Tax=Solanum lycopersicum TaxID=4081 RepID=K4AU63_SOLLC